MGHVRPQSEPGCAPRAGGQSPTAEGTARIRPFLLYVPALTQRHGNTWVGPSLQHLEAKKNPRRSARDYLALIRVLTGRTGLCQDAPGPERRRPTERNGASRERGAALASAAFAPRFPPIELGDTGGGMPATPAKPFSSERQEREQRGAALSSRGPAVVQPTRPLRNGSSPRPISSPSRHPNGSSRPIPPPPHAQWFRPLPARDPPVFPQRFRESGGRGVPGLSQRRAAPGRDVSAGAAPR